MNQNIITLDSLLGEHLLSGAFFDSVNEPRYEGSEESEQKTVLRFTLDGQKYEAVEDPDDGYRSSLLCIRTTESQQQGIFDPVKVRVRRKTKEDNPEYRQSCEDDVILFCHADTGNVIVAIGTDDTDDYYPSFVAEFKPENL